MATRLSFPSRRRETGRTVFPPLVYSSIAIGLSIMGILVRLQIQDNTLPSDLLIADGTTSTYYNLDESSTQSEDLPPAPRMVRAVQTLRRQHPHFDPSWDVFQRIEAEQTGRVVPPRTEPPLPHVNFIDQTQVAKEDAVASASWLQTTNDFLAMDAKGMDTVEDASHFAFQEKRQHKLRMTMDWLDFSVEHMPPWCDMMDVLVRDIPYMRFTQKLEGYVTRGRSYPIQANSAFNDTLAVVTFESYKSNSNKNQIAKARDLTKHLLAATMESLRRAGFGRTLVVGVEEEDAQVVQDTIQFLYPFVRDRNLPVEDGVPAKLGHMEVTFVLGNTLHGKTASTAKNIPRAALQGLQYGFQHNDPAWLGEHTPDDWKMVYFTGTGNILQTRPAALTVLKGKVEQGLVLIPHHLQPIPHKRDVAGAREKGLFLSYQDFNNVLELDALDRYPGICCDEHKGPDSKPGLRTGDCGKPWYQCDFSTTPSPISRKHERLQPYDLIQLTQGSQMTLLSASNSGRRCVPPKKKLLNYKICSASNK